MCRNPNKQDHANIGISNNSMFSSKNSGKQRTLGCLNNSGFTGGKGNNSMYMSCVKLPGGSVLSFYCIGQRVWGCFKTCLSLPLPKCCITTCCGCCACAF
ncbi:hypothetical protein PHAVU_010G138600 [Phaseolus vulgaris]|uniref:Uncharacterized protein n=1 Tax=Phaseolus vulgaris TaxID=3885 RepID=V7APF8_PHAVU|nr:hypothetical protein PHAVU_010G138600g [Phaseolus vulgaris]ESW07542.1 hypothetical protein PHAVU_010G138600g [Phaseolus vulgaris]